MNVAATEHTNTGSDTSRAYEFTAANGYTGINFTPTDVSNTVTMHLDVWSSDLSSILLKVVNIDGTSVEHANTISIDNASSWNSVSIPMSSMTGLTAKNSVQQFVIQSTAVGTVYLDNIYFESEPLAPASPIVGTWRMVQEAGAFGVGPSKGDTSWFNSSADDVTTRACFFDDAYVLNADGSFENIMDGSTWVEAWQGGGDSCATPVSPHDGSGSATYVYDADNGTLTLEGQGAFMGLAKAVNGAELASGDSVPASRTYEADLSEDGNSLTLDMPIANGAYWRFKFAKEVVTSTDTATTASPTIVSCTQTGTSTTQGDALTTGYTSTFETDGDLLNVTFELLDTDKQTGLVAILWEESPFSETQMQQSSTNASAFTMSLSGYSEGDQVSFACKFAYSGGFTVTEYISYTVGSDCSGTVDSSDSTASTSTTVSNTADLSVALSHNTNSTSIDGCEELTLTANFSENVSGPVKLILDTGAAGTVHSAEPGSALQASAPSAVAPTPKYAQSHVISIYSDAYTNVAGTNVYPNWGQTTQVDEYQISTGENALMYANLNYQGTEFGSAQDVSEMTHIHVDYWTADATSLQFYLIGNGETPYTLPTTATGKWNSIDIALSEYASVVDLTNVIQFKVVGNGTVYFDNMYFHDGQIELDMTDVTAQATAPQTAAPMPLRPEAEVISIFSDAYTDQSGTDFNPNWGQGTVVTTEDIYPGEAVLKYAGLNYQGTEFTTTDVSGKTHIHIDYWTADATSLDFYLISTGSVETQYSLSIESGQWNSIDIALSEYSNVVDLSELFQFKVVGNGTVYFDNLYFHNGDANTSSGSSPYGYTQNAIWQASFIPNDYGLNGSVDFKVANNGNQVEGSTGSIESLSLDIDSGNCATIDVTLSTDHPDTIVSPADGSVNILASFTAAVATPTLVFSDGNDTSNLNMVPVSGDTTGMEWTYGFEFSAPDGMKQFTISATGVNGESIANAATESLTLTYDSVGPFIQEMDVDDEAKVIALTFSEDAFSTYENATASGDLVAGDFSITISSTTVNLTSSTPSSLTVTSTFFADGDVYLLGFDYEGEPTPGDVITVNVASHTFDIAGNAFDNAQGDNTSTYEEEEEEVVATATLSHDSTGDTVIACEEVTITANFSAPVSGPIQLSVTGDSSFSNQSYTVNMTQVSDLAPTSPQDPAPEPIHPESQVLSIYSDSYTDQSGTTFNPDWGQSTGVDFTTIEGNNAMVYSNLNYQGTEFASALNVSGKTHLHFDYWVAEESTIRFFLISNGPAETSYTLPIIPGEWNSMDIALTEYSSIVDLNAVIQFKVDAGDGAVGSDATVYWDNIYFHNGDPFTSTGSTRHSYPDSKYSTWKTTFVPQDEGLEGALSINLTKDGTVVNTSNGSAASLTLGVDLGDCEPTVEALSRLEVVVTHDADTTDVDTCEEITVTANFNTPVIDPVNLIIEDASGTSTSVTVSMTAISEAERAVVYNPVISAPNPTLSQDEVLAIFSDVYENVPGTDYPDWGQSAGLDFPQITAGNTAMLLSNLDYQGLQFASPLNLIDRTHIHIDYWTSDAENLNFYLISTGPAEVGYSLPINNGEWNSIDIPLSEFSNVVDLADVIQFKMDSSASGTYIYFDNIYFHSKAGGLSHSTNPQYKTWETTFIPNDYSLNGSLTFSIEHAEVAVFSNNRPALIELDTCRTDTDGDGVYDDLDLCPNTQEGLPVNQDGCSEFQVDSDGDTIPDYIDNCVDQPNTNQLDNDGDGIGNVCDPDPSIEYVSLEVSEAASPSTVVVFFEVFNILQEQISVSFSDPSGLFALGNDNTIVLTGELDYEEQESYVVQLTGTTPAGFTTTSSITINVSDIPNTTYTGKFFISVFDKDDETTASKIDHTRYLNPNLKTTGRWKIRKRITGGADAGLFRINDGLSSSGKNEDTHGTLEFINAPDFEAPRDHNGDNIYEVEITYENLEDGAIEVPVPVTQRNIQMLENSNVALELQSSAALPTDDSDSDGIPDIQDNSPLTFNPNQVDEDGDGIGDVSDDFDHDGVWNPYDDCPDTPLGEVVDETGCVIFYTSPNNFSISKTERCEGEHKMEIRIQNWVLFDYRINISGPNTSINHEVDDIRYAMTNLSSGIYNVCITVDGVPSSEFERCFRINIAEPNGLSVFEQHNVAKEVVNFNLNGGKNYTIVHNGKTIQTDEMDYMLPLDKGVNNVRITTGIECQGVFEKVFINSYDVTIAPNPVEDFMNLYIGGKDTEAQVEIYTSNGRKVFGQVYPLTASDRIIRVDAAGLIDGTYYVKVKANTVEQSKMMIKE